MSYREIYKCNLCDEEKGPELMMGCRFHNLHRFTLDAPGTTKGTHICTMCLDQLAEQLGPKRPAAPTTGDSHG